MSAFQFGLFQCLNDKDACIITTVAPCFTLGKNAEVNGGNCLLHSLGFFTCCYGILGGKVRKELRERYDIPGSLRNDFIIHCFCPCCALVQDTREFKAHGDSPNQQFMARE